MASAWQSESLLIQWFSYRRLAQASERFAETDLELRRIWSVKEYASFFGKAFVMTKISIDNANDLFQVSRSRKVFAQTAISINLYHIDIPDIQNIPDIYNMSLPQSLNFPVNLN